MKINNISNQTFNGYKNLIANHTKIANIETAFISMQLDDVDKQDLSKFNEIKRQIPNMQDTGDILTLGFVKRHKQDKGILTLNDVLMLRGEEMSEIEKDYSKYFSSFNEYKNEENKTVKYYTFLSNLTKRIANDNNLKVDSNFASILRTTHSMLTAILGNTSQAYKYLEYSFTKNMPPQQVAQKFNTELVKSIMPFFK